MESSTRHQCSGLRLDSLPLPRRIWRVDFDLPERASRGSKRTAQSDCAPSTLKNIGSTIYLRRVARSQRRNLRSEHEIRFSVLYESVALKSAGKRRHRLNPREASSSSPSEDAQRVRTTLTGSTYAVDEVRNTNGTFTFASLETYQAGLPTTYTQRTISPNDSYSMQRASWYLQDSYRVNRSVMLNLTLRHDVQTRLSDWVNFAPRADISGRCGRGHLAAEPVCAPFIRFGLYDRRVFDGRQPRDMVISVGYRDP